MAHFSKIRPHREVPHVPGGGAHALWQKADRGVFVGKTNTYTVRTQSTLSRQVRQRCGGWPRLTLEERRAISAYWPFGQRFTPVAFKLPNFGRTQQLFPGSEKPQALKGVCAYYSDSPRVFLCRLTDLSILGRA